MKRKSLILGLIAFISIGIFTSCTKTNVRNGNSKIIGTWVLAGSSSDNNSVRNYVYTFSSNPDYENYTVKHTYIYSYKYDGKTVIEKGSTIDVNPDTTITTKIDTSYSDNHGARITFNKDGSGEMVNFYNNIDDNGNPDIDTSSNSFYWNWIDSYKEKQGISLSFSNNNRKDSYGNMIMYIDTLDRKTLVYSYTSSFSDYSENTDPSYDSYWDNSSNKFVDISRTIQSTSNNTSKGSNKMIKEEDK